MPKKSKTQCCGCHNNIYNHPPHHGCWLFDSAKMVKRVAVGTFQKPPYRWQPRAVMSCLYTPGTHWLERGDCRVIDDTDEAEAKYLARIEADKAMFRERQASHATE